MDYPYNEKHGFMFRFDSNDGERHLEMNCDELYLGDILARFTEFLRGCGYEIDGLTEVVVEYDANKNTLMQNPIREHADRNYDGYRLTEPPKHEPKWDFSNIPNNNWPFPEPVPTLTTADLSQIKPLDLTSLTVTDLSTMTTQSWSDWSKPVNQYQTMAPLTSEQIESFSFKTEMPGTLGGAKVKF